MKPRNSNSRPVTALSNFLESAEPISEQDKKRWAEEWVRKRLGEIFNIANIDEGIARESAIYIAGNDNKLSNLIIKKPNKGPGRPKTWTPELNKLLLRRYADAMIKFDGNHQAVRKCLLEYVHHILRICLSDESIENKITSALNDVRAGKISLSDLTDEAQSVIQTRIDKGVKTKKRTKTQIKAKPLANTAYD